MKRFAFFGLALISFSSSVLGQLQGDATRYQITCFGDSSIGKETKTHFFTWIIDESAASNEQIFNLGRSVCEGKVSCNVSITPYQIRVQTVAKDIKEGRHFTMEVDGTINRLSGMGEMKGVLIESSGDEVKRRDVKGSYSCKREAFRRVI